MPFALILVAVAFLLGFAGASCAVGRWVSRRAGSTVPGLLVSLVVEPPATKEVEVTVKDMELKEMEKMPEPPPEPPPEIPDEPPPIAVVRLILMVTQ